MIKVINAGGVTDAGHPVQVQVRIDEPAPAPDVPASPERMVVGTTVAPPDFPMLHPGGHLQNSNFCRTFSVAGDEILPWGHTRRQLPVDVLDFHSWVDWPSDSQVAAWLNILLDTMPKGLVEDPLLPELRPHDPDGYGSPAQGEPGFSLLLSYWHSGEQAFARQKLTAAEWRRRHRFAYRIIRSHPNGHRVGYIPVQTSAFTESRTVPGWPAADFDPFAWWAGVGDYIGYAAYATRAPLDEDPAGFLSMPAQLARATGRPMFLTEVGMPLQADVPNATAQRAHWIRSLVAEAHRSGVAGIGWMDALSPTAIDCRLNDDPSVLAWQNALLGKS